MDITIIREAMTRTELNEMAKRQAAEWIEFDSMINVRPSSGNRSRYVERADIRDTVATIVSRLIGE